MKVSSVKGQLKLFQFSLFHGFFFNISFFLKKNCNFFPFLEGVETKEDAEEMSYEREKKDPAIFFNTVIGEPEGYDRLRFAMFGERIVTRNKVQQQIWLI